MMNSKLVTIIIPTIVRKSLYNAVYSAQNQLGGFIEEIIISVDGKYKNNKLHLPEQSSKIPYRIVYGKGFGVSDTLNTAIENSKTKLISWLSDDDTYKPIKILSQLNKIRKHIKSYEDYDSIFSIGSFNIYDLNSKHESTHNVSRLLSLFPDEPGYFSLAYGFISGCSVIFSKHLWKLSGGFPNEFVTTQDYIFWKRLLDRNPIFVYSEYSGIVTTVHENMESKKLAAIHQQEKDSLFAYIYAGYMAKMQSHDLSISKQRQLLYTAPNTSKLFGSYLENDNLAIKNVCGFEIQLLKICVLFTTEPNENTSYLDIADMANLSGEVLRKNLMDLVGESGIAFGDNELGYFLDAYWYNGNNIVKIFGISETHFSLSANSKDALIYEALSEYRYLAVLNNITDMTSQDFSDYLAELDTFDTSAELRPYYATIGQTKHINIEEKYKFFVRDAFLANEDIKNVTH